MAESFDHYGLAVTNVLFWKGGTEAPALFPVPENLNAKAIFDPNVDYMYVNEIEFKNWIAPVLRVNIGKDLDCNTKKCWYNSKCAAVNKVQLELKFKLGVMLAKEQTIEINLEDYLVDSYEFDIKDKDGKDVERCYIPIFVLDAGQRVDAFDAWFLGNMFLNRYFIINDAEGSSSTSDPKRYPLVGIYDKVNPQVPKDNDFKPPDMPVDPMNPKDGKDGQGSKDGQASGGSGAGTKTDTDPLKPRPTEDDDSGMGAGWVIFILLIIFGGLGAVYKFFGE